MGGDSKRQRLFRWRERPGGGEDLRRDLGFAAISGVRLAVAKRTSRNDNWNRVKTSLLHDARSGWKHRSARKAAACCAGRGYGRPRGSPLRGRPRLPRRGHGARPFAMTNWMSTRRPVPALARSPLRARSCEVRGERRCALVEHWADTSVRVVAQDGRFPCDAAAGRKILRPRAQTTWAAPDGAACCAPIGGRLGRCLTQRSRACKIRLLLSEL